MSILGNPITLGGGGADLNIDFGSTPPTDTSKLWVPLASKPDFVECSPVLNYGSMYSEAIGTIGTNTSYITGFQNCMVGDWIYFIGPCLFDTGNYDKLCSKYLRRYNVKTFTLETVAQVETNTGNYYGYRGMCGCVVDGILYFFGGVRLDGSSSVGDALQNYSVYIYDTNSGEGHWQRYNNVTGIPRASKLSCCSIGTKIYIFGGLNEVDNIRDTGGYVFDTESLVFSGFVSSPGYGCSCCAVGDKIYVFGGYSNSAVYEYDTVNKTKTKKFDGNVLSSLATIIVPCININDKMFIFGNQNNSSYKFHLIQYDTTNSTCTDTGITLVSETAQTAWGMNGNDVYFFGGTSYNVTSDRIQKFTIQTTLEKNNLFLQADFGFDNPFPLISSTKSKFTAYLRNAYLGDANNIAQLTNAYIYDASTNQWKTLSGESYVADVLNALNIMGVT